MRLAVLLHMADSDVRPATELHASLLHAACGCATKAWRHVTTCGRGLCYISLARRCYMRLAALLHESSGVATCGRRQCYVRATLHEPGGVATCNSKGAQMYR